MKNNWQTKKIGEVCDFYNGLWKGKKPPYMEVGVIRNTNFTKEGRLDDSNIAYLDVEKKQFENRRLIYGDIILEKSGGGPNQPVGRVVIFDKKEGDFSFSNFTSAIRVKNPNELDFIYLHKFLFFSYISGITEKMQSHSTGIRNLDFKLYKEIQIPVPSLNEQKRIVKILDEVFEEIKKVKENAEKNLKNSKELFEAYLQNVFMRARKDWEERTLEQVCEMINRGVSPKYTESKGLCVLNQKCIRDHKINFNLSRLHDSINKKVSIDKYIQVGDVLVNSTGTGTLGRVAQVRELNMKAIVDSHVTIVRPMKNLFYNEFFGYALICIEKEIAKRGEGCGGQTELARNTLKNDFRISYPKSPTEQKAIVKKLDALSVETKKLEEIYQQKLADLEELKKSVLKSAFAGEL
jgi:type I restriction enzyme S subunit